MTSIEEFRKELLATLNGTSTDYSIKDFESTFKSILGEKPIFLLNEVAPNYRQALRILRLISNRTYNPLSDKQIERTFDSFIIRLKYQDDQNTVRREIDRYIVDFIDNLKHQSLEKYLFLIPVMNLKLESNIQIGDSSIVTWTDELIKTIEKRYSIKFGYPQLAEIAPEKRLPKCNDTETYVIVTIDAPDHDKAVELATQKAEVCLNLLRVYSDDWNFVLRRDLKKLFGVRLVEINLNDKRYNESSSSVNLLSNISPTTVTNKGLEFYNLKIRPITDALLHKKENDLTSLERDILTAIMWFGNAVKDDDKNMRFVKGIMALEALLIPTGGTGKCNKIAKNFVRVTFSGASDEQKKHAFEEMKEMYRIRNSILHSGEGYVLTEDVEKMLVWVRTTIQVIMEKTLKYGNLSELINKEFSVDEHIFR